MCKYVWCERRIAELEAQLADLRLRCLSNVTLCEKCGGTRDDPKYPGCGCCSIGHSRQCKCVLCQWRQRGYEQEKQLAAEKSISAQLQKTIDSMLVAEAKSSESMSKALTAIAGHNEKLKAQLKAAREALEVYASRSWWRFSPTLGCWYWVNAKPGQSPTDYAQKALSALDGKEK